MRRSSFRLHKRTPRQSRARIDRRDDPRDHFALLHTGLSGGFPQAEPTSGNTEAETSNLRRSTAYWREAANRFRLGARLPYRRKRPRCNELRGSGGCGSVCSPDSTKPPKRNKKRKRERERRQGSIAQTHRLCRYLLNALAQGGRKCCCRDGSKKRTGTAASNQRKDPRNKRSRSIGDSKLFRIQHFTLPLGRRVCLRSYNRSCNLSRRNAVNDRRTGNSMSDCENITFSLNL